MSSVEKYVVSKLAPLHTHINNAFIRTVVTSSSSHIGVYPVFTVRCARKTMKRIREVGSQLDYPSGPETSVLQLRGILTDTTLRRFSSAVNALLKLSIVDPTAPEFAHR